MGETAGAIVAGGAVGGTIGGAVGRGTGRAAGMAVDAAGYGVAQVVRSGLGLGMEALGFEFVDDPPPRRRRLEA